MNIKLLGGMAPTVSMEQLIYDCRLMNIAKKKSKANDLRDWLCESDSALDPQAYVLRPDVVVAIAKQIVADPHGPFTRSKTAARAAIEALRDGLAAGQLTLDSRETDWLNRIEVQLDQIPEDEEAFIRAMIDETEKLNPAHYDLV